MDKLGIENDGPDHIGHDGRDSTEAVGRMREAITAAAAGSDANQELEAAARELVGELRRANEPPEQMLLRIKRILAQAGLRSTHGPADPALVIERHSSVYRNVIESSIRHYFQPPDGEDIAVV
jgi:hypothetical protein